ncbi:uncharacterized protein [Littorina saxatilis]|uniref:Uncharacterized protein n=1 Tax=Littorina saxatilis TaxID=31220 RepID=A0AAN9AQF8_9CAEN
MEQKTGAFTISNEPQNVVDEELMLVARKVVDFYKRVSITELCLAALSAIFGAISIGFAIPKHQWPFLNVFPLVNGCLMLGAGYFAYKASTVCLDNGVPKCLKKYVGGAFGLTVSCMSHCGLAAGFSGSALGKCLDNDEDCTPNHDALIAFNIINIVLATLLYPICVATMVVQCRWCRKLGRCSKK